MLPVLAASEAKSADAGSDAEQLRMLREGVDRVIDANRRSVSNVSKGVATLDSLGRALRSPYSLVAQTLEAQLLAGVYSSGSYKFDRRSLPAGEVPADVMEWDAATFRHRIHALAREVSSGFGPATNLPLSRLGDIVSHFKEWDKEGMDINAFLTLQLVDALRDVDGIAGSDTGVIPFRVIGTGVGAGAMSPQVGRNSVVLADSILDARIEACRRAGNLRIASILSERMVAGLRGRQRLQYLDTCLSIYGNTPYATSFMLDTYTDSVAPLKEYLAKYPDAVYAGRLKNQISFLELREVDLSYPDNMIAGVPEQIKVTAKNIDRLWLLTIRLSDSWRGKEITPSRVKSEGRVVDSSAFTFSNPNVQFSNSMDTCCTVAKPGVYVIAPSLTPDMTGLIMAGYGKEKWNTVNVSDITLFASYGATTSDSYLYAIRGNNFEPVAGLGIRLKDKNGVLSEKRVTDANGRIRLPKGSPVCVARVGDSEVEMPVYNRYDDRSIPSLHYPRVSLFTDMPVYHPSDSVRIAMVAFIGDKLTYKLMKHTPFRLSLRNANYEKVDSTSVTTDDAGRAHCVFRIPDSGLRGTWSVVAEENDNNTPYATAGITTINVEDYKAPTLELSLRMPKREFEVGDTVPVQGDLKRYSGSGVAGAKVRYEISVAGRRYGRGSSAAGFAGEVTTNAAGEFAFCLATDSLRDSEFDREDFTIRMSAAGPDGETVYSPSCSFRIGAPVVRYITTRNEDMDTTVVAPKGAAGMVVSAAAGFPTKLSAGSWVFVEVSDCSKVLERRWLRPGEKPQLSISSPGAQNRVSVRFMGRAAGCNPINAGWVENLVTVIPPAQARKLDVKATLIGGAGSNPGIVPGKPVRVKVQLTEDGKPMAGLPVIAVMTNKALNSIAPFRWEFDPFSQIHYPVVGTVGMKHCYLQGMRVAVARQKQYSETQTEWPQFDFGGESLLGRRVYSGSEIIAYGRAEGALRGARVRGVNSLASAKMTISNDVAADVESAAENYDAGVADSPAVTYRDGELALGFFRPELVTDSNGELELEFTAPDFIGTWQLQVLGYDTELRGAVALKDIVSSLPLEARINAPRFLRTGDVPLLEGVVENKTDSALPVSASIEILNAVAGNVLGSFPFVAENVAGGAVRKVSARWQVPADVNYIEVRIMAQGGDATDGERYLVPVYPAVTPVTESQTFWLSSDVASGSFPVKEVAGASSTLLFCDNPIWECVKGLPALTEGNAHAPLSVSSALFGNAIGLGLTAKYPELNVKIREIAANASRESGFTSNQELKLLALDDTPWVMSARTDTLRLSSLSRFLDRGKTIASVKQLAGRLAALQNSDGGWGWWESGPSSVFMTEWVLSDLAQLLSVGFPAPLPSKCIPSAVRFVDKQYVDHYNRVKGKGFDYASMLGYLEVRSMLGNIPMSARFAEIRNRAIEVIAKDAGKMDVPQQALAAQLLVRAGRKDDAARVLREIDRYASVSPQKGEWFDNVEYRSAGLGIGTVAAVLEAYLAVDPQSEHVGRLRQWLLLTTMSQNWGDRRYIAGVVAVLLKSGSDWKEPRQAPRVWLADGAVSVERTPGAPAWGALVSQYQLPAAEVKAASTSELSISKRIVPVGVASEGSNGSGQGARLVECQLVISNTVPIDYLTVVDNRMASLAPVEQTSGYFVSDGIGMYREVRRASTQLFIPHLPKGVHVISYRCSVDRDGVYNPGIATAQSQINPAITAHSAGN